MLPKHLKCIYSVIQLLVTTAWVSHALAGQVQLAWNAPTTNTDGTPLTNLAGYKLQYWQTNAGTPQNLDVGNQTSYTLMGLVDGATYSIVVDAYNTLGIISSDSNILTITTPASNHAPVAQADTASTPAGTPVTINVLANDSDPDGNPLTITAATQGTHGTVTTNGTTVTYTPAATFAGTDNFSYTISDGKGGTATAPVTVTVTVTSVNHPPVANADTASTPVGKSVTISVLANDSDPDGDPLRITAVTQGAHGTVTFSATSVTYTPVSTYSGTDSFTYTITDGHGASATAPVTVTVKVKGRKQTQPLQVSSSSVTSTNTNMVSATAVVTIQLEAETGALHAPMEVQADKTTPTTQYVWVPDSSEDLLDPLQPGGYAQYSFTVPQTDSYVIWGLVSPSAAELGSFFLGLDVRGDNGLVLDISPTTYQLATIRLGATYYVDSPYTTTTIPTGLDGLAALKTANADKQNNSPDFLTFTTVHDATLYVAYDATMSSFPNWLSASFTNTGQIIQTTNGPMAVWKQDVPAGPITLPGNQYQEPTPVKSQYFVLLDVHGQEPFLMWDVTPTQTSGTSSQSWVWDQAASSTTPVFYLEAGSHTLTIKQRESGTKLDRLLITNDLTLIP